MQTKTMEGKELRHIQNCLDFVVRDEDVKQSEREYRERGIFEEKAKHI